MISLGQFFTPAIGSPSIVESIKIDPPIRLFNELIVKGIIDEQGNLKANWHFLTKEVYEEFNKRREAFFDRSRKINIKGLDLTIEFSWKQLIDCLASPSIRVEILKKNALHFLGFNAVDALFKQWGIDLEKTCGPEYVEKLRQEIDTEPSYELIHFYVNNLDPVEIACLKQQLINFVADRIPIKIEDPGYKALEKKAITILEQKEGTYYKHWLKNNEKLNLIIHNIIANELVAFKQIEPKARTPFPSSSFCLEAEGQVVEFEIASFVPFDRQSFSKDALKLPAADLPIEVLERCDQNLVQSIVDITCSVNTLIANKPFHYRATWLDILIQAVKGEVIPQSLIESKVTTQLLFLAQNDCLRIPNLTLGNALGKYVTKALERFLVEDSLKKHPCQAAIALTIAACEILANRISPSDIQEMIQYMARFWKPFTQLADDETPLYLIARAMESGISYSLISSILQLSAYDNLRNAQTPEQITAKLSQRGSSSVDKISKNKEDIIHLVQKVDNKTSISIPLLNQPIATMLKILDQSKECQKNAPVIRKLLNRLQKSDSKNVDNIFDQTWIPHLENTLPLLFEHLVSLLEKVEVREYALYFRQFMQLVQSKNSILSHTEVKQIEGLFKELAKRKIKTARGFYVPLVELFASFKNPSLNQAGYLVFKKLKDPSLGIAKAFCRGYIPNAVNAYLWICPKIRKIEEKYVLLELLLSQLHNSSEALLSIDILARELDLLFKHPLPFDSAEWLTNQLLLSNRPKLALKASQCISNSENRRRMQATIKGNIEEASVSFQSKESIVEKAHTLVNSNNFFPLINFLHEDEVQKPFKEKPEEFWKLILIPSLEKLGNIPLSNSNSFYVCLLNLLGIFQPTVNDLRFFALSLTDAIQKHPLQQPLNAYFLQAFVQRQAQLFSNLPNDEVIWNLARLCLLYRISIDRPVLKILLEKMTAYLNKESDPKIAKVILELLSDSSLREEWQKTDRTSLGEVYKKISECLMPNHLSLAISAFKQHQRFAKVTDAKLVEDLMDICIKTNQPRAFCRLTAQFGRKQLSQFIDSWQIAFKALFLSDSKEIKEWQIKVLSTIVSLPSFKLLLSDELACSLLDHLKKVPPSSSQFVNSLDCYINVLSKRRIHASYYLNIFDRIETIYQPDLLGKTWDLLKTNTVLSKEEKTLVFKKMLPKVNFMEAIKVADLFNSSHDYLSSETSLAVYVLLFARLEKVWKELSSDEVLRNKTLASMKRTYAVLEKSPGFNAVGSIEKEVDEKEKEQEPIEKTRRIEKETLQLAYTACLSTHPETRQKNRAHDLLNKVLKDHFAEEKAVWDPNLVERFREVLKRANYFNREKEMTNLMLKFPPHHELGCLLIRKLMQNPSDQSRLCSGELLNYLMINSKGLTLHQYKQFQQFCTDFDLKKFCEDMSVLCGLTDNLFLIEFLQTLQNYHFMSKQEVKRQTMRAYSNVCLHYYRNDKFNDKVITGLIQNLPELLPMCSEEEQDRLFSALFPLIHQWFGKTKNVQGYINYFILLDKALKFTNIDNTSEKEESPVYHLTPLFFRFVQSTIARFFRDAHPQWVEVLFFLADFLLKCDENTVDANKATFNTWTYFTIMFLHLDKTLKTVTRIFRSQSEEANEFHILAIKFLQRHFKEKDNQSIIEGLKAVVASVQDKSEKECSNTVYAQTKGSNPKIELIQKILKTKGEPEIILRICLDLFLYDFMELLKNFNSVVNLLDKLSEIVKNLDSVDQFQFFEKISEIFLCILENTESMDAETAQRFRKAFMKNFVYFSESVAKLDINDKLKFAMCVEKLPNFISMHQNLFTKQTSNLENCLKIVIDKFNEFLQTYGIDDNVIKSVRLSLVGCRKYKNVSQRLTAQWINKLKEIDSSIEDPSKKISIIAELFFMETIVHNSEGK